MLKDSIELHRQGRIDEAEAGYRAELAERPDDADALHLLGMLRCQRDELFVPIRKERIAADEERANAILHHCHERGFNVACASGSQDNELQPDGAYRFLQLRRLSH